jgi:hypothetical protein
MGDVRLLHYLLQHNGSEINCSTKVSVTPLLVLSFPQVPFTESEREEREGSGGGGRGEEETERKVER